MVTCAADGSPALMSRTVRLGTTSAFRAPRPYSAAGLVSPAARVFSFTLSTCRRGKLPSVRKSGSKPGLRALSLPSCTGANTCARSDAISYGTISVQCPLCCRLRTP